MESKSVLAAAPIGWGTSMSEILDMLHREFIYIRYYFDVQLRQVFGYWVIGILLGSCVSVFLKDKIHGLLRSMSRSRMGLWGIVPASLLGIASPLCMYGTIPLSASFSRSGMRDEWLASFMMCSILLNPQLIVYSTALGTTALIIRIASCFLCGIAAGLLLCVFQKEKSFFRFDCFDEPISHDTDPNPVRRLLKNIGRNIKTTGPYFLLGILLSALFQRYVPEELMTGVFGGNEAFGVLMAATIGVPLYACGGGTIPLLQAWLMDGMSMGSAAAFMITGPSTKITNLGALKIVLGLKHFIIYIVFVMAFSLITGIAVNLLN